jgi:hypothetical protein
MHSYLQQVLCKLSTIWTATAKCSQTKQNEVVALCLMPKGNTTAILPVIVCIHFSLDSCLLEGEGSEEFKLNKPNIFTVCAQVCISTHAEDWFACVLNGRGEILSVTSSHAGVQVTY